MTVTTIALVLLGVALAIASGGAARRDLAGVRARRRAAWELDRAEWRRWMARP
ncbi:MAG: hypothetical protein ACAI18_20040 [Gemmatimonadales bacterium]